MKTEKIFSVICKWSETDGSEQWDVVTDDKLEYQEALDISISAGKKWDDNAPTDMKHIKHDEIVIKHEELLEMLKSL